METNTLQILKEFSPFLGAIVVLYLMVRLFVAEFAKKGKAVELMMERFLKELESNRAVITNHIEHNTEAMKELSEMNRQTGETNRKLELVVSNVITLLQRNNKH